MSFLTLLLLTLGFSLCASLCVAAAARAEKTSAFWGYVALGDVLVLGGFWWALGSFGPAAALEVYAALMVVLTFTAMWVLERWLGWLPLTQQKGARRASDHAGYAARARAQLAASVGLPWVVASGMMLRGGAAYFTIATEGVARPLFFLGVLYLFNRFLWKRG